MAPDRSGSTLPPIGGTNLILLAVLMSSIAALTGIFAVGNGRHWKFNVLDYFRGKRNAILYLWVTFSTIFSICHSGVLIEWGLKVDWTLQNSQALKWAMIHASIGVLLVFAHLFVASTLSKEVGPVDKYLWGAKRRAHQ